MQDDAITDISQGTETYAAYESAMRQPRLAFANALETILAERDPKTLLLFWIYFSACGVGMTEPVEDWIYRAGNRCKTLGYSKLGEKLCKHAVHEADHHLMMIEDTQRLVAYWNKSYAPILDAETLLNAPVHQSVIAYQDLHEHYINSDYPYGQITIEYEIENISALYGSAILTHTLDVVGETIRSALSFLDEHARIDVAHTQYNRKALQGFLSENPEALPTLIQAGQKALTAYWAFLEHCYKKASA